MLNPFLIIKCTNKNSLVLSDLFNKKDYILNKDLFIELFSENKNEDLYKNNILITKNSQENILFKKSNFWLDNNCFSAFLYHTETYKYPFLDYTNDFALNIDNQLMNLYKKKDKKLPSVYKLYNTKKISLETKIEVPIVNVCDVFDNNFKDNKNIKSIDAIERFKIFIKYAFGETKKAQDNFHINKTIPSGGSKHPTEAYIIFPKNSFIKEGVYHYNVKYNCLDIIQEADVWDTFLKASYFVYNEVSLKYKNKFSIVYTSLVERAMFRYRDIRSTRAVLCDVGHIVENSILIGKALCFNHIDESNIRESIIKDILQIKNSGEIILSSQMFFE